MEDAKLSPYRYQMHEMKRCVPFPMRQTTIVIVLAKRWARYEPISNG